MAELHRRVVIVHGVVDTAHHALIVTKEKDGETGDAVDGNEKASLLEPVDHIGLRNEVHGDQRPWVKRRRVKDRRVWDLGNDLDRSTRPACVLSEGSGAAEKDKA